MKIAIISKNNYPQLEDLKKNFTIVEHNPDICVAIGGDGTFIKAARSFKCPLLPIRTNERGSLGYYADVSLNEMSKIISLLKSKNYTIEPLSKKLYVRHKNRLHYAINEILLRNNAQEIYFSIKEIDGKKKIKISPFIISGDGLIITSAMGSTAYNKSAGGPIIMTPKVLGLTFLNPDGPYTHPMIIDGGSVIEIKVEKYNGRIIADNFEIAHLVPGDSFIVDNYFLIL